MSAAEVFEENSRKVFGYIMKMTGSREDAEDCYQECYLKFCRTYSEKGNAALLFSVARSVCIDFFRKNKSHESFEENMGGASDPEREAEERECVSTLKRAMEMLDEKERDIISMAGVQGLKYDEIAQVTGLSVANIKVKVHRTRLKLKKMMTEMSNG